MSRTPVAAAIQKLEADRLVEVIPQSATRVSKMSMKEIREDAFLREALEVAAVEHAAAHCTAALTEALELNLTVQEEQLKAGDFAAFFKTDQDFHNQILDCCKIERLHDTISFVSNHMDRARLMLLPAPGRSADTVKEHRQIVSAIAKSDPAAARTAMQTHLRQLIKRLEPLEKERPDLFAP